MLWILASVAIALLSYEIWTLATAVLIPLLSNPNALQTDFHYYYAAAQRFAADPNQLYSTGDDVIAGFAYPPPAILPFVALTSMPLGMALALTTLASYAALLVASIQWLRYLDRHGIRTDRASTLAILLIAGALGPSYMNAIFGQVNAFVLASAVAFAALTEAMPLVAGLMLALGGWLKLYPALMIWTGAWDRTAWRAIGYAAAAALIVGMVSLFWIPAGAYGMFASFVLPSRSGTTAIHVTNQSLVAFLERFRFEPGLFLHWTGQQAVTVSGAVTAINIGLLIAMLGMLMKIGRAPHRTAHAAATLMAMVAVVAPLGWGHTYVMALPLVILALIEMRNARTAHAALTSGCVVALMIPAGRHLPLDTLPSWLQNVAYSRYLIATIVLVAISTSPREKTAGSAAIARA